MNINLPANIRAAIYIITAIGTPVIAYLGQEGVISSFFVGLWAVATTAVLGLARLNVSE